MRSLYTIHDAEEAVQRKCAAEGFRDKVKCDWTCVVENERWWHLPGWIGCSGFIINKSDLYVNWLGSFIPIKYCYWGHDHGLFNDLVDFEFHPETDRGLARKLIERFENLRPNAKGKLPEYPIPYRDSELDLAFSSQFPTFKRHNVWSATKELFEAHESAGLRFTSNLSK